MASGSRWSSSWAAKAIAGADVLASAYGAHGDSIDTVVDAAHALVAAARAANIKRVIVVGGAGSLEVAPGVLLVDAPTFPAAYRAYALAHNKAFHVLKSANDLDWTFFSPAAESSKPQVEHDDLRRDTFFLVDLRKFTTSVSSAERFFLGSQVLVFLPLRDRPSKRSRT